LRDDFARIVYVMDSPADDIFSEAWELDPSARGIFLDLACAENAELRREVERLLADAERADAFFVATFGERGGTPVHRRLSIENAGDMVGPYRLLEKIGEGGCGVVWLAEQAKPISRRVAVKVIKAGMETEEVLSRFGSERQALARMDHPNIARVIDAGVTEKGRPYFAMELVNGIPITRFCDEHHLDTKARLVLFSHVCAAVNHAHQKGVIHRDIKPSNVLVALDGDKPVVKVIDFGIAKAVEGKLADHTLLTRFGQPLGTPAYMSPEQAGLDGQDIDTRSDIYGLGVLLYELLAGVPPFDPKTLVRAGYDEMRRIIREVDPVRPSARLTTLCADQLGPIAEARQVSGDRLTKLIASDLDWIVMKAIEKSRERRYETADSFAQDIRRFIACEPVAAKPPTATYLLGKFAKRNRTKLLVATGFLLLLVVATVASAWQAIRARKAEALAERRLAETTDERNAKDLALQDAEAVSNFLADVFQRPDPEIDGKKVTVAEALDNAANKIDAELGGQPERLALLKETLARTYAGLGLYSKSLEIRKKVLENRLSSLGEEHPATREARSVLAATQQSAEVKGRFEQMESELARLRRQNGPEDRATLVFLEKLASSYYGSGYRDDAVRVQEELVGLMQKKFGEEEAATIESEEALVYYLWRGGQWARSVALQSKLAERRKRLFGSDDPATLIVQADLSGKLFLAGKFDDALAMAGELVPVMRKVFGSADRQTLDAISTQARCLAAVGRTREAIGLLTECAPQMRDDTFVNLLLANLQLWFGLGDEYNKTRRWMIDYAKTQREQFRSRPDILERAVMIACLAPLENPGQGQELLATLARCKEIRATGVEPAHFGPGPAWRSLIAGMTYYRIGDYSKAADALAESGRLMDESEKKDKKPRERSLLNLYRAMGVLRQGNTETARQLYLDTAKTIKPPPSEEQPLLKCGEASGTPLTAWLAEREAREMLKQAGKNLDPP